MKKLRLLITDVCDRACEGCCNKDWDLDSLPVWSPEDTEYDEVLITGGEPLLLPDRIIEVAKLFLYPVVKRHVKVVFYTAKTDRRQDLYRALDYCGGVTVTLHEQKDAYSFVLMDMYLPSILAKGRGLRLNVFNNVVVPPQWFNQHGWKIKYGMEWIENCPLPQDEVFMRYAPKETK